MLEVLKRQIERLNKAAALAGGLFILVTGVILFIEVILRTAKHPTDWINEWSVYLFSWAVLLGGAYTLQQGKHVRVELMLMHLSEKARLSLDAVTSVVGAGLCCLFAWEGWLHFADVLETGETSATTLRVPLWLTDFALPLGFVLLALQFLILAGERWLSILLLDRFNRDAEARQHEEGKPL